MTFEMTYVREAGPPHPTWDDYARDATTSWRELLDQDLPERAFQAFLETHPSLVPGAWTPGTRSGHYPVDCALVSQPSLPGLASRQPDFMWIANHSGAWYPTLIEIETPRKRIFTKHGIPTAQFSEARNQLAQWRTWFGSPTNVQLFLDSYGIPLQLRQSRQMVLHMILIYGRRAEFEEVPSLSLHRASLLPGHDEELISFDRLAMDPDLKPALTVKATSPGEFECISVPPVFETGPVLADRLARIGGFEQALRQTPVSDERRAFLLRRIDYWRNWARSEGANRYRPTDWE